MPVPLVAHSCIAGGAGFRGRRAAAKVARTPNSDNTRSCLRASLSVRSMQQSVLLCALVPLLPPPASARSRCVTVHRHFDDLGFWQPRTSHSYHTLPQTLTSPFACVAVHEDDGRHEDDGVGVSPSPNPNPNPNPNQELVDDFGHTVFETIKITLVRTRTHTRAPSLSLTEPTTVRRSVMNVFSRIVRAQQSNHAPSTARSLSLPDACPLPDPEK